MQSQLFDQDRIGRNNKINTQPKYKSLFTSYWDHEVHGMDYVFYFNIVIYKSVVFGIFHKNCLKVCVVFE